MKNARKGFRGFGVVLAVLVFSGASAFAGMNEDLINAAKNGNINKAKTLISKGANVNAKDYSNGMTALMWAIEKGHLDTAKLLISKGADINAKDNVGGTALMFVAWKGHLKIAKLLIFNGADINAKTNVGATALMYAAGEGYPDIAKLLIFNGADINAKTNVGETALMFAAWKGHLKIAKLLISKGADANANDKDSCTALTYAKKENQTDTVRFLKSHGAFDLQDLINAAKNGNIDEVKTLLSKGADIHAKDSKYGETALMYSAEKGHPDIAKLLISKGANVNVKTKDGQTALMRAAGNGQTKTAKLLLDKGADVNAKDKYGRTALMFAEEHEYTEIIQLLKQAGANRNLRKRTVAFSHFSMDNNIFSCSFPKKWEKEKTGEKKAKDGVWGVKFFGPREYDAPVMAYITFYANTNPYFKDYKDFIERNSTDLFGEKENESDEYGPVKKIKLNKRTAFKFVNEIKEYTDLEAKNSESVILTEKYYVIPSKKGFHVLHFTLPKKVYAKYYTIFHKIALSFRGI